MVSELLTNSVKHTRSRFVLVTVTRIDQDTVRIAVVDKSPVFPDVRTPGDDEDGGRGLLIVEALTDCWGTDPLPWGKRVWGDLISKAAR